MSLKAFSRDRSIFYGQWASPLDENPSSYMARTGTRASSGIVGLHVRRGHGLQNSIDQVI